MLVSSLTNNVWLSSSMLNSNNCYLLSGSEPQTLQFIQTRQDHESLFEEHRNTSVEGYVCKYLLLIVIKWLPNSEILTEIGMEDTVTPYQAKRKWENLKKRHRVNLHY